MAQREIFLEGAAELEATLRRFGAAGRAELAGALYREGEAIMTEAKSLCPVDTGALRASGQVRPPFNDGEALVVEMGFGNTAVNYALYVHEDLTAHHENGQAKFLEQPLLEHRDLLLHRLAEEIQRAFSNAAR